MAVQSHDIENVMRILPYVSSDDIDRMHNHPLNCTVLHVACTNGSTSIVQLLIWVSDNLLLSQYYDNYISLRIELI